MVAGVGACTPARLVTNAELEKKVDTSDEWIVQRTGIRSRYFAGEGDVVTVNPLGWLDIALRAPERAEQTA